MGSYSRYASAYPTPDYHGRGYSTTQEYLHINSAGVYLKESPEIMFSQSVRQDYYFTYHYGGGMFLQRSGEAVELRQGDAFFLLPGQPISYWYKDDGQLQNYWIHFTGYAADSLLEAFNFRDNQIMPLGQHIENGNLFNRIIDELGLKKSAYQTMCAGYLLQLIANVSRQLQSANRTLAKSMQTIEETLQYIHRHYPEKLLVTDLARMAYMSVNRFEEEFRSHTGYLPARYIVMYRIERAVELIQKSLSMGQIAEMVGFENQMYFSRVFKKLMKITPSQYKANYVMAFKK